VVSLLPIISQTCSIGFRSGDLAGHGEMLTPASFKNCSVLLAIICVILLKYYLNGLGKVTKTVPERM
jgi:hypothetical protein